jgi:hypothetical protein
MKGVSKEIKRAKILEEFNNSLKVMKTDYIDLINIHFHDPEIPGDRGFCGYGTDVVADKDLTFGADLAMVFDIHDELIAQGKLRFKGIATHSPLAAIDAINNFGGRMDTLIGFYCPSYKWGDCGGEFPVSSTFTLAQWEEAFALAKSKDIGTIAMKVMMSPCKTWSDRVAMIQGDAEATARLKPFIDAGATTPQACIRWALSNQNINTAIIGMRTVAQATENAKAGKPPDGDPIILPSAMNVKFEGDQGGANPLAQTLTVTNAGGGTLADITTPAAVTYEQGKSTGWLTVTRSGTGNTQTLTNTVVTGALAAGEYQATVTITSQGASNSPLAYSVTFSVKQGTSVYAREIMRRQNLRHMKHNRDDVYSVSGQKIQGRSRGLKGVLIQKDGSKLLLK